MSEAALRAGRTPCGRPMVPVALTPEQREHVEGLLRRAMVKKRVYLRERALLSIADGVPASVGFPGETEEDFDKTLSPVRAAGL